MPVLKQTQDQQERRRKIFPESRFIYDPQSDTYGCPGGQTLTKRQHWVERKAFEYVTARGVCQQCSLRAQCTQSESGGRTLKRHERQELLDQLRAQARSATARRDIRIRQHFMEGWFAQATRFGLKRARWRGQWRVQIQDYLIATVQNIELLIAHARPKPRIALAWVNMKATNCAGVRQLTHHALSALGGELYIGQPAIP
jgi:hypothetical protein